MRLLKSIHDTLKKNVLVRRGSRVLIGVSGGPDSVALLYLLHALRKEFSLALFIGHLDHGIRKDSAEDCEFVKKLGKAFGIPVIAGKVNLRDAALRGSVEENARKARIEFFCRTARKINADVVAIGHTQDDQAETVIMRLLRGSGLQGLRAIQLKKILNDVVFIRPLLRSRRKDIIAYLKKRKAAFRVDSTNKEDIYFRNKIRHYLIPVLEKNYNRNIIEVLSNFAETAGQDYDFLDKEAEKEFRRMRGVLNIEHLKNLHPAIFRLVIRRAISRVQHDTRRITYRHMKEIEDLIFNRPVNSVVNLPQGLSVKKGRICARFDLKK
ncbi:MAG: tRNA lysidine(34) synthetase TilS [Candidatus Omnitrophica bacterium]|nr:tRNA lysidine(34) synthetase TilS [Candidatus Omnitrophota bacterium]